MSAPSALLGDIASLQAGIGFPPALQGRTAGDFPFAKVGDISRCGRSDSSVLSTADHYVDQADVFQLRAKLIPAGSVLFAKIGEAIRQNHRVMSGCPMLIDNNAMAAIPSDRVDGRFLYNYLKTVDFYALAPATTVPALRKSVLETLRIPLPPLVEQRRIAAILDQAETLRTQRRAALAQLDSLTQALFFDMFGDPVANPKGIPVCELQKLCTRITDGTHQSPKWVELGVPFLFISNIVDGAITFDTHKFISEETYFELTRRCPIEIGDVLYTTVGSYGNAAIVTDEKRFAFQRHIAHIKPDRSKTNSLFLAAMIQSIGVRRQVDKVAKGVAQKTVNLADLKGLTVFAPSFALQQTFATRIQAIESLKSTHRTALSELDALFASLQQRAFAGEL